MRELSVSTPVKAPAGFTVAFLTEYVTDTCGVEGKTLLPMRFTLTQLAGLTLERDVNVRVEYAIKDDGSPAEMQISWDPDAKLFPRFEGKVNCEPTGEKTCLMTIAGNYDAPGGVAGQLFDAIVGVRIAQGTLERLLAQFRDAAEADYMRRTAYP